MAVRIFQLFLRIVTGLIAKVEIDGLEKIPRSGGCVIAGNHIGRLEVLLFYVVLRRSDVIMIAAEKYQKYAIFRWLARQLDVVFVDRYNADMRTVREVLKRLKKGMAFAVAPEGTRSKTASLQPARPGTAYIASKAGVPIFPVGITGTEDRLVKENLKRLRRTRVYARVGEPFMVPPLPREDRDGALEAYTNEIMCRIAALLPAQYRGVYSSHPRLRELLEQAS
jgi:1-acyl-sn-glycerol-3-phosphate acyltransferase